jgi:hypothetical protein
MTGPFRVFLARKQRRNANGARSLFFNWDTNMQIFKKPQMWCFTHSLNLFVAMFVGHVGR